MDMDLDLELLLAHKKAEQIAERHLDFIKTNGECGCYSGHGGIRRTGEVRNKPVLNT